MLRTYIHHIDIALRTGRFHYTDVEWSDFVKEGLLKKERQRLRERLTAIRPKLMLKEQVDKGLEEGGDADRLQLPLIPWLEEEPYGAGA